MNSCDRRLRPAQTAAPGFAWRPSSAAAANGLVLLLLLLLRMAVDAAANGLLLLLLRCSSCRCWCWRWLPSPPPLLPLLLPLRSENTTAPARAAPPATHWSCPHLHTPSASPSCRRRRRSCLRHVAAAAARRHRPAGTRPRRRGRRAPLLQRCGRGHGGTLPPAPAPTCGSHAEAGAAAGGSEAAAVSSCSERGGALRPDLARACSRPAVRCCAKLAASLAEPRPMLHVPPALLDAPPCIAWPHNLHCPSAPAPTPLQPYCLAPHLYCPLAPGMPPYGPSMPIMPPGPPPPRCPGSRSERLRTSTRGAGGEPTGGPPPPLPPPGAPPAAACPGSSIVMGTSASLTGGGLLPGVRMAMMRPCSGPWFTVEVSSPQCCAVRCASRRCRWAGGTLALASACERAWGGGRAAGCVRAALREAQPRLSCRAPAPPARHPQWQAAALQGFLLPACRVWLGAQLRAAQTNSCSCALHGRAAHLIARHVSRKHVLRLLRAVNKHFHLSLQAQHCRRGSNRVQGTLRAGCCVRQASTARARRRRQARSLHPERRPAHQRPGSWGAQARPAAHGRREQRLPGWWRSVSPPGAACGAAGAN